MKAPVNSLYEESDASVRWIATAGLILVAGIAFSFGAAALFHRNQLPARPEMSFQHGPENDSTIVRDWHMQDDLVRHHLDEYGWIDRKQGLVRIPIERAMELTVRPAAAPVEKSR